MNTWADILQLINVPLETLDEGKKFKVDAVGSRSLVVIPDGGKRLPRAVRRESMERAFAEFHKNQQITRAQLGRMFPNNQTTSYMLAICHRLHALRTPSES